MLWFKHTNPSFKIKILDYTYTSQPSINYALPLVLSKIKLIIFILGVIFSLGFVWLVTKWSAKKKAFLIYSVCNIQQATNFFVEQDQIVSGSIIVKSQHKYDINTEQECIGFNYHQRTYLYSTQKQVFLPIRNEHLGLQLDRLKKNTYIPYSVTQRQKMLNYYGKNVIRLPVQGIIEVFIENMLTPYEVFQTYAIILWIYEQYYIFAFLLLFYALWTYYQNSNQVVNNQKQLARQSYFEMHCKALINSNQHGQQIIKNNKQMNYLVPFGQLNQQILVQQAIQKQPVEMINIDKYQSKSGKYFCHYDGVHIKIQSIHSHSIVPGDIIFLKQGDTVPCDCILLQGQVLVNQAYITGQSYLVRKKQLHNLTYTKQNQSSFLIHMGTILVQIKKHTINKKNIHQSYFEQSMNMNVQFKSLTFNNEIICLVQQTNYNTLRGKYLRAIKYQKKQQQTFTTETIYFIYIILALTTIVFICLLPIISINQFKSDLFILYLDLLSVSIPPTLPTVLSVGINFCKHRLRKRQIYLVLPSNILTAGRANSIILEGESALGKNFHVEGVMVGIKKNRAFGPFFSSVSQFQQFNHQDFTHNQFNITQFKQSSYSLDNNLIYAMATCHTLEFVQDKIQGSNIQKSIFEFSKAKIIKENEFYCMNQHIIVLKRILYRDKQKKLAVVVGFKTEQQESKQNELVSFIDEQQKSIQFQREKEIQVEKKITDEKLIKNKKSWMMFVKGSPEKILPTCLEKTIPKDSYEYIIDMAEKGFNLLCYAVIQLSEPNIQLARDIPVNRFYFLGFIILKRVTEQCNSRAIKALRAASVKTILVSQERQLQSSSIAIVNDLCTKNQLLLCTISFGKNRIFCRGHTEWQSSMTDSVGQFIDEFSCLGRESLLNMSSFMYQQLYMKRQSPKEDPIFNKIIILNRMQYRHQRSLYQQLQRRAFISCAVGGGGILCQCANVSMQLRRQNCSVLSSFHTASSSLQKLIDCLCICRAGLSTNFHTFSMMILFSMVQFTTVCILQANYQIITPEQTLYEDLFVTFPIFVTINLTSPVYKLSKQLPTGSFFSPRALSSMIGQLVIQFFAQISFLLYVLSFQYFQKEKNQAKIYYQSEKYFMEGSETALACFILSNYIYLGIVLSTSVSKPFRKPFYTNPFYTLNLVILWVYNTLMVLFPSTAPQKVRKTGLNLDTEFILILAMIYGNLIMVLMYMYENLLLWIWNHIKHKQMLDNQTIQNQQQQN